MGELIKVGMADMKIVQAPDIITTLGLGSCVGVVIYDLKKKMGGLIHVMLPDSTAVRNNVNIAKFADTGIRELMRQMEERGCLHMHLQAKMAGGAQMFAFHSSSDMVRIGVRNIEASRQALQELKIPLLAEDTGMNYGRTIVFHPDDGRLEVRAVGKETKIL